MRWFYVAFLGLSGIGVTVWGILDQDPVAIVLGLVFLSLAFLSLRAKREGYPGQGPISRALGRGTRNPWWDGW